MSRPPISTAPPNGACDTPELRYEHLCRAIEHASHLLPAQGPIGVFVHHNTLHAFQHLPFEEAVLAAGKIYGAEPYLSELAYQEHVRSGRILEEDIAAVLAAEPDAEVAPGITRRRLRRAMLLPGVRHFSAENIEWQMDECGLLERLRPDLPPRVRDRLLSRSEATEAEAVRELLSVCFRRLPALTPLVAPIAARPRDGLRAHTGIDTDEIVHPWLIRLCASFVDQGLAYWPMPEREQGFYLAVRELLRQPGFVPPDPLRGVQEAFAEQAARGLSAAGVALQYLDRFAVNAADWETLVSAELLALPGWAGMLRRLEVAPDLAPYEEIPCTLTDYLAVRLTLAEVAAENALRRWRAQPGAVSFDPRHDWKLLPDPPAVTEPEQLAAAAALFDVAQLLGLSANELRALSGAEFSRFHSEVRKFDEIERRRVLHLAYERRHEELILRPLRRHRQSRTIEPSGRRPAAQVFFCLDEREESIRRALEELDPEVETLGAAGFYGVAMSFQGLDDPRGVALCPVVVTPRHVVRERPASGHDTRLHQQRQNRRKLWSDVARGTFIGSRTLVRGWVGTLGLGLISLVPLMTRVLAPRTSSRMYDWLAARLLPEPSTELTLKRQHGEGSGSDGLQVGFSVEEKAERVASVLRPAGLVRDLSRMVVVLGHGSTTRNNPHESAYCCGACGGRSGGPNARLFASMANRPEVRKILRERGISIPDDTWFVGGYHDTCSDAIQYYDLEAVPATHRGDLERVTESLNRARAANALERSRRFEAAWKHETPERALRHVQERAEHLAEPRPEYGHATNAVCIVGRRAITRGLFLDRRAFLVSYDPDQDPEDLQLSAALAAAGPVCAGINLEYYFSTVDNGTYGCGTKLPHNVTGLLGVMDGPSSDLRTGLPRQTVEIHEPVRLLLVVETTPERLRSATSRSAEVTQLIDNRWIRVATLDPDTGEVHVDRGGSFELLDGSQPDLPQARSSEEWYAGKRDPLPLAQIIAPEPAGVG